MKTTVLAGPLIALALLSCQKAAPPEPVATPPPATPAPLTPPPATPPPATPLPATPPPATPPPATPTAELAPPGVFYLLTAARVETNEGITGLTPGTGVKLVRPGIYLTPAGEVPLDEYQLTNDMAKARIALANYRNAQAAAHAGIAAQDQQAAQMAAAKDLQGVAANASSGQNPAADQERIIALTAQRTALQTQLSMLKEKQAGEIYRQNTQKHILASSTIENATALTDQIANIDYELGILRARQPSQSVSSRPQTGGTLAANGIRVNMINENGVHKVPVQMNGIITENFVIDSGAADVCIPSGIVLTLMQNGTIKDSDFLPGQIYVLADGSKEKSQCFMLRSINVGGSTVANVEASIGGPNSGLLLGQTFLKKFRNWSVDNNSNCLILNP